MVTKEESKEKLKQLITEFKEGQKYWDSKPEEDIKHQFIEPLFEDILGWGRKNVEKESRVLKGRADYILKIGHKESLVIEAKKTTVSLREEEGRQAVSYAYHRKIKFAVLTNFKNLKVYHALSNIKNIDKNLLKVKEAYFELKFEEFIEKFDILWLLSRESFEKEEINKLLSLKDERLNRPIDESILSDLLHYREWLSKDLKSKRAYLTEEQIDEIVQTFIDRLIFMRSVEDRGLEEKDFLLKLVDKVEKGTTDKNLWSLLIIQFKIYNKLYDSSLFEEGLLEKEGFFEKTTLIKIIKGLYFGTNHLQERYMFDEIPGDLLGNIYEQYLGTVLMGTEKRIKLQKGTGKRKKMGIYYTPSYIVDYIVENIVGEYIKNKTLDQILEIKIVDPACGSGSFLIKAFQRIIFEIEKRLKEGESSKWKTFQSFKGRISLAQKSKILENCIYGVDLDGKAIELAQLNLLLKLLEEETKDTRDRALPMLRHNLKGGNSLIDDLKFNGSFKWESQFSEVFSRGGFDIVIGNPPYGAQLSKEEKVFFKKRWPEVKGTLDTYILFLMHSTNLLMENGRLGFIIPQFFLINSSSSEVRKHLLENSNILKIVDYTKVKVFDAATKETIIYLSEKDSSSKKDNFIEIITDLNKKDLPENQTNREYKISQKLLMDESTLYSININLDEKKIKFINFVKKGTIPLGQCVEIIDQGIKTGDDKKFLSKEKLSPSYKLAVNGRHIKKYALTSDKMYVLYNPKKLAEPKNEEIFLSEEKILMQYIRNLSLKWRLIGTLDTNQIYSLRNVKTLLKKKDNLNLSYILALINSKLLNYYYSLCYVDIAIKKNYLEKLPIKIPSKEDSEYISSLVSKIIYLNKKIQDNEIVGKEKIQMEGQIKDLTYEIDQKIFKIYNLEKGDIEEVNKYMGDSSK